MTTYLTTEQAVELAKKIDLYLDGANQDNPMWVLQHSDLHHFASAAIQTYIDSLAEGLPEPAAKSKVEDFFNREQLLACIAKEQDKWHAEHKCECSTEDACRFARERDTALKELACIAKAKGEK